MSFDLKRAIVAAGEGRQRRQAEARQASLALGEAARAAAIAALRRELDEAIPAEARACLSIDIGWCQPDGCARAAIAAAVDGRRLSLDVSRRVEVAFDGQRVSYDISWWDFRVFTRRRIRLDALWVEILDDLYSQLWATAEERRT